MEDHLGGILASYKLLLGQEQRSRSRPNVWQIAVGIDGLYCTDGLRLPGTHAAKIDKIRPPPLHVSLSNMVWQSPKGKRVLSH